MLDFCFGTWYYDYRKLNIRKENKMTTELEELGKENGKVKYDGVTYYLLHQAYVTYNTDYIDDVCYTAQATDQDGEEYTINWRCTYAWINQLCNMDDESNACDWDKPAEIIDRTRHDVIKRN